MELTPLEEDLPTRPRSNQPINQSPGERSRDSQTDAANHSRSQTSRIPSQTPRTHSQTPQSPRQSSQPSHTPQAPAVRSLARTRHPHPQPYLPAASALARATLTLTPTTILLARSVRCSLARSRGSFSRARVCRVCTLVRGPSVACSSSSSRCCRLPLRSPLPTTLALTPRAPHMRHLPCHRHRRHRHRRHPTIPSATRLRICTAVPRRDMLGETAARAEEPTPIPAPRRPRPRPRRLGHRRHALRMPSGEAARATTTPVGTGPIPTSPPR